MAVTETLVYDWMPVSDLSQAIQIELDGYPEDEAATLDAFKYRQANAGHLFLAAYIPVHGASRELVGYICATQSPEGTLTHESMERHVPGSESVCIHSVCVSETRRRNGVGLNLLREYVDRIRAYGGYKRVLLMAHEELIGFYQQAGFILIGKSAVQHGSRDWFELRLDL